MYTMQYNISHGHPFAYSHTSFVALMPPLSPPNFAGLPRKRAKPSQAKPR